MIQERFFKADDNMKLRLKEQFRKIAYPETTDLKPPSQLVKKKAFRRSSSLHRVTIQRCSLFCILNMLTKFFRAHKLQNLNKKIIFKGVRISKPPSSSPPSKISFIDEMSVLCANTLSGSSMLRVMVITII